MQTIPKEAAPRRTKTAEPQNLRRPAVSPVTRTAPHAVVGSDARLASLIRKIEQGIYLMPTTRRAVELCLQHGITLRSAYRRAKSEGVIRPDPLPARGPVWLELRFARSALRRAEKKAEASGPTEDEIALLEKILVTIGGTVGRWRGMT